MQAFVIGNVTIDETILVDEMPTSGVSIHGRIGVSDLGGKGTNQAVVLGRCSLKTTLIAAVGDDLRASAIRHHLKGEPVESVLVERTGAASDASLIFRLPDGENANVTTAAAAESLTLDDIIPLLAPAQPGDFAVLQGNLSDQATCSILNEARRRGLVTAFNPSPLRPSFSDLWPLVDIAFLNRSEAQALTGAADVEAAARLLDQGLTQIVLTLGDEGAVLVTAGDIVTVPAFICPVVDTTGAGDTFMAVALASAALRGSSVDRTAIEHAVKAAAITVSRPGTRSAFPTMAELRGILSA